MMRWLHLSDLHFSPKTGTDSEPIRSKIMKEYFLKYLKNSHITAESLLITGDFGYAPDLVGLDKGELEKVADKTVAFIRELADTIGIRDINSDVHVVPGNHDLTRSPVRTAIINGILSSYADCEEKRQYSISSDVVSELTKSFVIYFLIIRKLFRKSKADKIEDEMTRNIHFRDHIGTINLLCLNTAIFSGLGKDTRQNNLEFGKLLIGNLQVERLLSVIERDNNNPTIVMGHHFEDFFDPDEKQALNSWFQNYNIQLILCGHAHKPNIDIRNNPRYIVSGSFFDKYDSVSNASFFVCDCTDNYEVRFELHTWRDNKWGEDSRNNPYPVLLHNVTANKGETHSLGIPQYTTASTS